jgi:hypothetical protein
MVTTNTFVMSGMISLGEAETRLLESLELTVPTVLTPAELKLLVKKGRAQAALSYHDVLTPLVTQVLNDIDALAVE